MIRPSGPVPLTFDNGIPRSKAIFLAIGDANMRSPFGSSALDPALGGDGNGSFEGSGAFGASAAFSSLGGGEGASLAALAAKSAAPERSSPSSARIAMVLPTETFFDPSGAYDVDA